MILAGRSEPEPLVARRRRIRSRAGLCRLDRRRDRPRGLRSGRRRSRSTAARRARAPRRRARRPLPRRHQRSRAHQGTSSAARSACWSSRCMTRSPGRSAAAAAGALGYVHKSEAHEEHRGGDSQGDDRADLRERGGLRTDDAAHGRERDARPLRNAGRPPLGQGARDLRSHRPRPDHQQIGESLFLSPKTVQTYRQRIKEKLGLETAAELSTQATRWVVERPPE